MQECPKIDQEDEESFVLQSDMEGTESMQRLLLHFRGIARYIGGPLKERSGAVS